MVPEMSQLHAMLGSLSNDEKINVSKEVVKEALERFPLDSMVIAITGGKDSTTALWIYKQVCEEFGIKLPKCIFIDEGDVFDEITEFVAYIKKEWSLDIEFLKNEDVLSKVSTIGDIVKVSELSESNQLALKEDDFQKPQFHFMPDSEVCNHLMKTVPMREFIVKNNIKAVSTGIRWDEHEARKDEEFFSPRSNPPHTRVHPILHLSERDIWITISKNDIPHNKLYKLGFRSLGARCSTGRNSDVPAWMQDLEHTPERVGRGQEKEAVMGHLRDLGYM